LFIEHVHRDELDVETVECGSVRAIDRPHSSTIPEKSAYEVGADVSGGSSDRRDHEAARDA
jgi:hypothetical protein